MKQVKKILSLTLVIAMLTTLFTVSASAAGLSGDDEFVYAVEFRQEEYSDDLTGGHIRGFFVMSDGSTRSMSGIVTAGGTPQRSADEIRALMSRPDVRNLRETFLYNRNLVSIGINPVAPEKGSPAYEGMERLGLLDANGNAVIIGNYDEYVKAFDDAEYNIHGKYYDQSVIPAVTDTIKASGIRPKYVTLRPTPATPHQWGIDKVGIENIGMGGRPLEGNPAYGKDPVTAKELAAQAQTTSNTTTTTTTQATKPSTNTQTTTNTNFWDNPAFVGAFFAALQVMQARYPGVDNGDLVDGPKYRDEFAAELEKAKKPATTATTQAPTVTVESIPATGTAYAATQIITIDGKKVEFQAYALKDATGNATNYVKLRDIAYALNSTSAQFAVGYDGTISITTKTAYTASGAEMTTPYSGNRTYQGGTQTVKVDGKNVSLTAITLTDDNGGGYNYFKLRDLGAILGFDVGYSNATGITITTK